MFCTKQPVLSETLIKEYIFHCFVVNLNILFLLVLHHKKSGLPVSHTSTLSLLREDKCEATTLPELTVKTIHLGRKTSVL